jgi:hypothetical protein
MGISPLFKWFGSKWLSAPKYPAPEHELVIEPFAGGAGYSLRHCERRVLLCENDPHLSVLWPWLIGTATEQLIRDIPIDLPEGTDIRTLGLSEGQALLLKNWQRTNNVGDCWTISPWGNKPGQWTANTRARVAEEVGAIGHWTFYRDGLEVISRWREGPTSTWFVDPMYEFNYQYRQKKRHDYEQLGTLLQAIDGQVIVCEAVCQKTNQVPSWLPFELFGERITSRRKATNNHHSKELIWTNRAIIDRDDHDRS